MKEIFNKENSTTVRRQTYNVITADGLNMLARHCLNLEGYDIQVAHMLMPGDVSRFAGFKNRQLTLVEQGNLFELLNGGSYLQTGHIVIQALVNMEVLPEGDYLIEL